MVNNVKSIALIPNTTKYRDDLIQYDLDYPNRASIVRQRTYYEGVVVTPITPLLQARIVQPSGITKKVPKARQFMPRTITACIENANTATGVSKRRTIIPYRPTDSNHKALVVEIFGVLNVFAGEYAGESLDRGTKPYFVQPQEQA